MARAALIAACIALAAAAGPARGDDIEVRDLALRAAEPGMLLDADFAFQLSPRLADYRLAAGPHQQTFATLEEALQELMRVRNWLVIDRTVGFVDADYEAAVRMRLDAALLPKPFQLSALTSPDLQLESPWKRFTLRSPRHRPAPVETRVQEAR
jgi:hypothetical protein